MKTPIPINPCPNCGSKKIWHVHNFPANTWNMMCGECNYCGKEHSLHRKAIRRWNKRYE